MMDVTSELLECSTSAKGQYQEKLAETSQFILHFHVNRANMSCKLLVLDISHKLGFDKQLR